MGDMSNWIINPIDAVVLAVLIISAGVAFLRGFFREVSSIASWFGAILVTVYSYFSLRPVARGMIDSTLLADAVTIGSIFLISLILLSLLGRAISDYVRQSRIGAIDRSLGFLFGLVRGGVVLCLLYIGLVQIAAVNETPNWMKEAKSNDLLRLGAEGLLKLVPPDSRPSLEWNKEPTGAGITAAVGSDGPAATGPAAAGLSPDAAGDGAGKIGYKPDQRQALENLFRIQRPDGQNTDGKNTDVVPAGGAGGGSPH